MPVRVDIIQDLSAFDNAVKVLNEVDAIAVAAGQDMLAEIKPLLLAELAIEPGKPVYPIDWQSEKQRKAFFASNGFGGGIPYKRTGGATKEWDVRLVTGDNLIALSVSNPNKYLRYVRGRQGGRTGDQVQRMHKATGWTASAPIIDRYVERARDVFLKHYYARLKAKLNG